MNSLSLSAIFLVVAIYLFAFTGTPHNIHDDFSRGATVVTIDGYHVKITAEQRRTDKKVQVVAYPQEQGVLFHIQGVQFGKMPHNPQVTGPVAKVRGSFTIQESNAGDSSLRRVIPVEVIPVNEFSITPDEARMQGNVCFQKDLSHMLSDN